MGFFSGITDTLFGDSGEAAAEAQSEENIAARKFIAEQTEKARGDILPLFGGAGQSLRGGAQQALGVLGGALPQQLSAFQQGNVGAQQSLLSGLPQFQSAILGTQAPAAQTPVQLELSTGIPGAGNVAPSQLSPEAVEQIKMNMRARSAMLGGIGNTFGGVPPQFSPETIAQIQANMRARAGGTA
jgi:hypothetical protein